MIQILINKYTHKWNDMCSHVMGPSKNDFPWLIILSPLIWTNTFLIQYGWSKINTYNKAEHCTDLVYFFVFLAGAPTVYPEGTLAPVTVPLKCFVVIAVIFLSTCWWENMTASFPKVIWTDSTAHSTNQQQKSEQEVHNPVLHGNFRIFKHKY